MFLTEFSFKESLNYETSTVRIFQASSNDTNLMVFGQLVYGGIFGSKSSDVDHMNS